MQWNKKNILSGFWLLAIIIVSCKSVQTPVFKRIEKQEVYKVTLDSVYLRGTAIYYNPNKMGLKVVSSDIDVFMRENYIGKVVHKGQIDVLPKLEFSVPFEVHLSLADLAKKEIVSDVFQMLNHKEIPVKYKGHTKVKILGVHINVPIEANDRLVY